MHQDQHQQDYFRSDEKRKKVRLIVALHLLIVAIFFIASFIWGNFA